MAEYMGLPDGSIVPTVFLNITELTPRKQVEEATGKNIHRLTPSELRALLLSFVADGNEKDREHFAQLVELGEDLRQTEGQLDEVSRYAAACYDYLQLLQQKLDQEQAARLRAEAEAAHYQEVLGNVYGRMMEIEAQRNALPIEEPYIEATAIEVVTDEPPRIGIGSILRKVSQMTRFSNVLF